MKCEMEPCIYCKTRTLASWDGIFPVCYECGKLVGEFALEEKAKEFTPSKEPVWMPAHLRED